MITDNSEEAVHLSFDSAYDVFYDNDAQLVTLKDVKHEEAYLTMEWIRFNALVKAYYAPKPELIEKVIHAVLNYRKVRIIPTAVMAGVLPLTEVNVEQLALKIMHITAGIEFDSPEQQRQFYIDNFGIEPL